MKAIKAVFLIVVVLGLIAFAAASMWLGRGVKLAIERFGPGITGGSVTVGSVMLAPWSGRGAISNLVIGNPPGFKGARALSVGAVDVHIKLKSLVTDTIIVESVVVREPEISYELGNGGSNLTRLQKNAEAATGAGGGSASGGGKSLTIKDLVVSGGQIGVSASALGGKEMKIPLPAVHLQNLGGKGKTPAQAAAEVLGAISGSVGRAVSGIGSKALNAAAASVIGRLGGLLKGGK